jgi:hemerythrin superfamily protein
MNDDQMDLTADLDRATDAVTLLTSDHEAVRQLFKEFEASTEPAAQQRVAQRICAELTVHAQIEERIFYPEVRSVSELEDMVRESIEEHQQLKTLVNELEPLPPEDELFQPKMKVLMEDVEHHAGEEEKEMFPKVREAFDGDKLAELGRRLQQEKARGMDELRLGDVSPGQRVEEDVKSSSNIPS